MLLVMLLVLLIKGVLMDPAIMEECDTLTDDSCIDETLKQGLLSNTDNINAIKAAFKMNTEVMKLCVRFTYNINWMDLEDACENTTAESNSSYTSTLIWTSFNPTTFLGMFLLQYAALNWEVLGFEWFGACDLSTANTPALNISVSALYCKNRTILYESLKRLTKQISSVVNFSDASSDSYSTTDSNTATMYLLLLPILTSPLTLITLTTVYSLAEKQVEPRNGRKPKAYFQFWAFHVSATGFGAYLAVTNYFFNSNGNAYETLRISNTILLFQVIFGIVYYGVIFPLLYGVTSLDVETPTQCCRCCCQRFSHYTTLVVSVFIMSFLINFFTNLAPTLVIIYFLYPTRTLIRIPLIVNSIFYINSLLALLLFQCERLFYSPLKLCEVKICKTRTGKKGGNCLVCFRELWQKLKHRERVSEDDQTYRQYEDREESDKYTIRKRRAKIHDKFYLPYYISEAFKKKPKLTRAAYLIQPLGTIFVMAALIIFIVIISDIMSLEISTNNSELDLLLTLVPTVGLLFGSYHKLDLFFDIEGEVLETDPDELLQEVVITSPFDEQRMARGEDSAC